MAPAVLQRTCLRTSYSLRTQLLLSFGISAFLSLCVVVVLACTSVFSAGRTVKERSNDLMRQQVTTHLYKSTFLVAEKVTAYMNGVEGTVQLIAEAMQDRLAGYPQEGWDADQFVPFTDMISGTRKYPLNTKPAPLDWQIEATINQQNAKEHLQERSNLYSHLRASSASGSFFMQGSCDPDETDTTSWSYFPNCTQANNNVTVGGVLQPAATTKGLFDSSGDLTVFLKALYESQFDIFLAGIYFKNGNAGAALQYPGNVWNGASLPYTSIGCDWMRSINKHNRKPFATEAEIAKCHPNGAQVPQREYNPMERAWCRDFALAGGDIGWSGPYLVTGVDDMRMISVGKAVFDRITGDLIGCIALDIDPSTLGEVLASSVPWEDSHFSMVRFDDGQLVSDTLGPIAAGDDGMIDYATFLRFKEAVRQSRQSTADGRPTAPTVATLNRGIMTAYPLPIPPKEHDPFYKPLFLAIHSVSEDIFQVVDDVEASIDQDVMQIVILSVGLGVLGMVLMLATIYIVSHALTRPLLWIESVAWRIVNHNDQRSSGTLVVSPSDDSSSALVRCAPRTEINELVSQFEEMIQGFSGSGPAKVADMELHEVRNGVTWHSDFSQLYSRSNDKSYRVVPPPVEVVDQPEKEEDETAGQPAEDDDSSDDEGLSMPFYEPRRSVLLREQDLNEILFDAPPSAQMIVPPPSKRNRGSIIDSATMSMARIAVHERAEAEDKEITRQGCTLLFVWIFALIIIPLVATNAMICGIVSRHIVTIIPSWMDSLEDSSYWIEFNFLEITARAKASLMTALLFESVRDLHLVNRVAGWLAFEGIDPNPDTFTRLTTLTGECQAYPYPECPHQTPCLCDWQDFYLQDQCSADYNKSSDELRSSQTNIFSAQASDIDPFTGNRRNSSYPNVDDIPEKTIWYDNDFLNQVPGRFRNDSSSSNLSRYATTYDRFRLASAMAAVEHPTYNYPASLGRERQQLGIYIGMEADGLFSGYAGCSQSHTGHASWQSSADNRAYLLAPDICPLGKFGYDCRCRGWYETGKQNYLQHGEPVHITAPYPFAVENDIAASATSAIANHRTGEYIGQTLLDFYPFGVRRSLQNTHGDGDDGDTLIAILITPDQDATGGDTVVGPNASAGWESAAIGSLLFPETFQAHDRDVFERGVLAEMKNGSSGIHQVWRTSTDDDDDGTREVVNIAFAPVYGRMLLPLSPDDFARGVSVSSQLLYSVGVMDTEEALRLPFTTSEGKIQDELRTVQKIYISITVLVSLLFMIFTSIITLYVTKPTIALLRIVRSINKGDIDYDLPPLKGGSREVQRVYNTFVKLYKVVRISNSAFFSRNLQWAHHFLTDALELFRKVNDRKAIGIACNNLGNTLFAMSQELDDSIPIGCTDGTCVVCEATRYYNQAIDIAQADFDNDNGSNNTKDSKAEFALQLADRLFNRGLFLLHVDGFVDCAAIENARDEGYSDMARARALDLDVKEYWIHRRMLRKHSAQSFGRLVRRINGLSSLHSDIGLVDVWDVKELVEDADQLLFAAWNQPSAPLFRGVTRVGRLQQLEGAAISLSIKMGNIVEAAKLAMRMFAEDEYLLEGTFVRAAEALLLLSRNMDTVVLSDKTITALRDDLKKMLKKCKHVSFNLGKCLVFCVELSKQWEGDPLFEKVNAHCLSLYDRCVSQDDYMSVVAYGRNESLAVDLTLKEDNAGRQRTLLDIATQTSTELGYPVFSTAFQMVVDSPASVDRDAFIIAVLDGRAWEIDETIRLQIQRLNEERTSAIHLFLIGFDVTDPVVLEQCQRLASVTKLSLFCPNATLETIDEIFDKIRAAIAGASQNSLQGITMEKF